MVEMCEYEGIKSRMNSCTVGFESLSQASTVMEKSVGAGIAVQPCASNNAIDLGI